MEDQFQEIPHVFNPSRPQKSLPKRTIVLIAVVVLVLISVVFIRLSGSKKQNVSSLTTPSQSPSQTTTSSPVQQANSSATPVASSVPKPSNNPIDKTTGLDRSKLNVVVENGSGGAGAAGKAADYLKGLGYNIVSTSNADSFSYSNVVIQVQEAKSDYLGLLKKDLGFNYTIGTTSADLSSGASEDAVVIIGQ